MKTLLFTVTNDLNFDQRMIRICTSLQSAGYNVVLVGRKQKGSTPLYKRPYQQKRLACFFEKGKAFYIEFNLRLLLYGLLKKFDLICAIDLDTIVPCLLLSILKKRKRVYDAHELFCEMKEIKTRPHIYKIWKWVEEKTVPRFPFGYTVNKPIQEIFFKTYGVTYEVIRNMPVRKELSKPIQTERYILYQGAVNEGRSFETLIPAFYHIDCPLWIYGDGNFLQQAMQLTKAQGLQNKVLFKGKLVPEALFEVTQRAVLGITLFENNGLSNYYSLANRFFDYVQAGIPQLCVAYPVYKALNEEHQVAVLIDDLTASTIANKINQLLNNAAQLKKLRENCELARSKWNWEREEKTLLQFYKTLLPLD